MTRIELKQKMMMCITTLEKLTGKIPTIEELFSALGNEYEEVLADYSENLVPAA